MISGKADTPHTPASSAPNREKTRFAVRYALFASGLITVCTLAGCEEPLRQTGFVRFSATDGWRKEDPAETVLDLKDTLRKHTLYLTLQFREKTIFNRIAGIPLIIEYLSPQDRCYRDTVILPLHSLPEAAELRSGQGFAEIEYPYRDRIRIAPEEAGRWKITFRRPDNSPISSGSFDPYRKIAGIGIRSSVRDTPNVKND